MCGSFLYGTYMHTYIHTSTARVLCENMRSIVRHSYLDRGREHDSNTRPMTRRPRLETGCVLQTGVDVRKEIMNDINVFVFLWLC